MAFSVNVKHDANKTMAKLRDKLVRKTPGAAATALNRTLRSANTAAVRSLQKDLGGSSQRAIRDALKQKLARRDNLRAELSARTGKRDRIPIYQLGPRPREVTKRRPPGGVRYGTENKLLPGSFIAKLGGKKNVYARLGKKRFPVTILRGPSVALVLGHEKVYGPVQKRINETISGELKRAIEFGR